MLRIGLTGGIASGKSHVLARLAARGFHALDLDRISHELMAPGAPAHAELVAAFGAGVLAPDGTLDRKRLGALVFGDEQVRARLNAIMHTRVRTEEERRASAWRSEPGALVVSDAALLVEAGVHLRFDRLVVVHCRPEQQLERLMARDGLDRRAAQARIDAQLPADEKRRFGHFVVDSSGSLAQTERDAERVADALSELARVPRARLRLAAERAASALARGPERGPRGLTPATVVEQIAEAGGLELASLARRLDPPAAGPWYRAARPAETPGPETLSAAVVLWSLARGAPDPEFVLAAAASLARLTHREAPAIASACLFARALLEVAVAGRVPSDLTARAAGWDDAVRRWAGETAADRLRPVFEAAARHGSTSATPERGLPGALVGLAEPHST
jgi:dephospho-CoA kinase